MLMVSNATAVPTTKSQSTNKILSIIVETQQFIDSKIEELNIIEEKKPILEDGTDSLKEKFQQSSLKFIAGLTGPTGPFIDWLINLIENIIAAINSIIDFIQGLLNIGELIDLLISAIQQLVDIVTQFIEWIIGIFSPDGKFT